MFELFGRKKTLWSLNKHKPEIHHSVSRFIITYLTFESHLVNNFSHSSATNYHEELDVLIELEVLFVRVSFELELLWAAILFDFLQHLKNWFKASRMFLILYA